MINVEQLTSQLRMLPDAALQRVAMMYKSDPYIFPMVISEGMARKKLRAAGQAGAAQGPQPKVADQAIMAMAPQDAGIGALQARSLNIPDGGIAGYADGGDVVMSPGSTPSYQRMDMSPGMLDFAQRSEPVVRMAGGGVPGYAGRSDSLISLSDYEDPVGTFLSKMPVSDKEETAAERKARRERERELEAAAEAEQRPFARLLRAIGSGDSKLRRLMYPTQEEIMSRQQGRDVSAIEAAYRDPRRAALDVPNAPTGTPRAMPPAPTEERAAPAPRPPAPAIPAAPPAPVAPQAPIPTYAAPTPDATAAGIAALQKAPDEATKKAYQEMMGMYEPERKELEERRGKRGAEALLRAGLAMMSGTSPYAMANIGKGGIEGLNAYQEAQRYDDQAAKALRQAEISMRMAQRQEEAGNRRDAISLFGQAQQMQQAAASSAQQAQQIQQTGDYQRGSLVVMQQNAASNARLVGARIAAINAPQREREKMMSEYGKLQKTVMEQLGKDSTYMLETDPVKRQKLFDTAMKTAVAQNPFLASTLFLGAPTGKVRDPYEEKTTDTPD